MHPEENISIHDILIPRQMCPVMTSCTSDHMTFESLPWTEMYFGWSMVRWSVTLLNDDACIVVEKWGSTDPQGTTFTEDESMREDHEFESLHDAMRHIFRERQAVRQAEGEMLDRKF